MQLSFLLVYLSFLSFVISDTLVCTNGFSLVNGAKCLKLFATPVKHRTAEASCAAYGGTLVTIRNAIDNRAVSTFVGNSGLSFWIGIYCMSNDPATCYFDDDKGTASAFNSFARGFPNVDLGGCVCIATSGSLNGQWISSECDDVEMAYVCEIPTTRPDFSTWGNGEYVRIYDSNGSQLGSLTGSPGLKTYYSSSNVLTVSFYATSNNGYRGFSAKFLSF